MTISDSRIEALRAKALLAESNGEGFGALSPEELLEVAEALDELAERRHDSQQLFPGAH